MSEKRKVGVWIDKSRAFSVTMTTDGHELKEIKPEDDAFSDQDTDAGKGSFMGSQHVSTETKQERKREQHFERFLETVADELSGAELIYIFGPAEAKNKLKNHLAGQNAFKHAELTVETADNMTENQVVARVREFFQD